MGMFVLLALSTNIETLIGGEIQLSAPLLWVRKSYNRISKMRENHIVDQQMGHVCIMLRTSNY